MLRFSRFFPSRHLMVSKAAEMRDSSWKSDFVSKHGISNSSSGASADVANQSARTFADYTVFKGKAAVSMRPTPPTIRKIDSASQGVRKPGSVMLTFWPAIGQRKYDWGKKQVFALSATEAGSLISLGPTESCDFLHDPSMKSSLEGQVKKSLSVAPMGNDNGYFLHLSVVNTIHKTTERFSVPVTKAEFTVMRTILSYALPHILGWDQAIKPEQQSKVTSSPHKQMPEERPDPNFEWER